MYTTDALRCHDPFHFCLLSFCLTAPGKWKNLNESPIRQGCDIGNHFCKHHKCLSLSQPFCWYTWGTEIGFIHRVLIGFNLGNQGFLAFQSDSRVLISITHQFDFFSSGLWHISVQAERSVMINERQILSTRTFY